MFILLLFVWNMSMASFLTIPLYKLICNISELEQWFSVSYKDCYLYDNDYLPDVLISTMHHTNVYFSIALYICVYNIYFIISLPLQNKIETICFLNVELDMVYTDVSRIDNYYELHFISRVSNYSLLEFKSLQDRIIMCPGETGLIFFRLFNPTCYDISGISLYFVYPNNISIYIHKMQCFCFDYINIKSNETIELPILFFIDKLLLLDNNLFDRLIYISYIFFSRY